ncbi:MAG: hypothetical protein JNL04_02900 [Rhodospirillaceae bacterium]|nr:hypothetical protein [Rhodospirillaceae bacterium]
MGDSELARLMAPRLAELQALTIPARATEPSAAGPKPREDHPASPGVPVASPASADHASSSPPKPVWKAGVGDSTSPAPSSVNAPELSVEMKEFLADIAEHPYRTTVQRRDALGLSTYKNDQIKKEAIALRLAKEYAVNRGGATSKLAELTEAGWQAIGRKAASLRPQNISAPHWHHQRELAEQCRQLGLKPVIEMFRGGTRVDVGAAVGNKLIAFEIAMTPKNEAVNARKDLAAGFDLVIIACKNAKVRDAVEEKLSTALAEDQRARVKVMLLSEGSFLKSVLKGMS